MGCGCKKNKKRNNPSGGESTSKLIKEQKDYRTRVNEAIRQFADLKKRKFTKSNS